MRPRKSARTCHVVGDGTLLLTSHLLWTAVLTLAAFIILAMPGPAYAADWTKEVVEAAPGQLLSDFCLEAGPHGDIYLAYPKKTGDKRVIVLAHRLGPHEWEKTLLDADPGAFRVDLHFDSAGQPHIMYVGGEWNTHYFGHLYRTASGWRDERFTALGVGIQTHEYDFAIDSSDRINVVYRNVSSGLSFGRRELSGNWTIEPLFDQEISLSMQLALGDDDTPYILATRYEPDGPQGSGVGVLSLLERQSADHWEVSQLEASDHPSWSVFALRESGEALCVYTDDRARLHEATRPPGGDWQFWVLPMNAPAIGDMAMLETSGITNLAYYAWREGGSLDIVIASENEEGCWNWETVGNVAEKSLSIDIADSQKVAAALAYGDDSTGELVCACVDYPAPQFTDVPSSHPYAAQIANLASREIVAGTGSGMFKPDDPVTRQQFAKMIVLGGGYPVSEDDICKFGDVQKSGPDSLYPDNFVAVCVARGITQGKTSTRFAPYDNMTRAQLITMVARAANLPEPPEGYAPPFGNFSSVHYPWARKAHYAGLLDGLLGIDAGGYDFWANATRGEVCVLLYNLMGYWGNGGIIP